MARKKYDDKAEHARYCKGRARKIEGVLLEAYDGHDIEASLGDALADILHLCAQKKIDFWDRLDSGQRHFAAEVEGGEHG